MRPLAPGKKNGYNKVALRTGEGPPGIEWDGPGQANCPAFPRKGASLMSVPHIDPAQAIQKMDAGEALVVDVRQPDEHELQRIPGSLLLPLDDINAESAARVLPDKNALTYVYCRSGVRSTAACEKLEALGYTNLYNLGGLTTWPYEVE